MTAGANILVVDDDPDMRETLEMILEAAGYSVATACDGEECLIALKKRKPDLLLLDLLMPKMDGFDVCKALNTDASLAECSGMPIVILSSVREGAGQRRYELEMGVRLDVDDYVEKPVESAVLLRRIGRILEKAAG
jgi:CheY-like chemotaxis protein